MISEDCYTRILGSVKLNIVIVLFIVVLVLPEVAYFRHHQNVSDFNKFGKKLEGGPTNQVPDIPFDNFLELLSKNKFSGTWASSIKESKLLEKEKGTIQLKSQQEVTSNNQINYKIILKIFDGQYKDNGYYQVHLNSSSLKTHQQFIQKHLIYQTTSPLIGLYRYNRVFVYQKQKPIYINKLKFRLNYNQQLNVELLFAAEYEINIITQGLETPWTFFLQILFTIAILIQVLIQGYGTFFLLLQMNEHQLIANSVSPTFLKLGYYFDVIELLGIVYFCYQQNLKILPFAAYFLFLYIIYPSCQMYQLATGIIKPYVRSNNTAIQSQHLQIEDTIMSYVQNNRYLNSESARIFLFYLGKYQNLLMCVCSFFIFYMNNMQNYIYFIYFGILLVPQLIRNCRQSNKINYSFEFMLCCAYPRLIPIIFLRVFGLKSLIMFEPDYWFCFICVLLSFISCCIIYTQKRYGSRSILPKFLIPKGMKTKFKFFMIQDQNFTCVICKSQLAQLPPQLQNKIKFRQQVVYNKVVATPCHHKFHAECLDNWMESRVQCPSCNNILPPTQQS